MSALASFRHHALQAVSRQKRIGHAHTTYLKSVLRMRWIRRCFNPEDCAINKFLVHCDHVTSAELVGFATEQPLPGVRPDTV